MEDTWRIPFTLLMIPLILSPLLSGSWLGVIAMYLWSGFLVYAAFEFRSPKLILFWLPAIWIEKVREWVTKDVSTD